MSGSCATKLEGILNRGLEEIEKIPKHSHLKHKVYVESWNAQPSRQQTSLADM